MYLFAPKFGHKLTLQNFVTNVFLDKKVSKNQQQQNTIKHKNPCQSWEVNPGPLAPKAYALPLHHCLM